MKQNIDHHNLGTYKDCKTVKLFTTTKLDHGTNVQSTRSWNSTMFCFCSFIQVQSRRCQARILIFLDSFSEHVLLGGCRGFSGNIPTTKNYSTSLISSSSKMEGIPFSWNKFKCQPWTTSRPPSANRLLCLFPPLPDGKRILIAEHIFLDT